MEYKCNFKTARKLLSRQWARGVTTEYTYDSATGELLKADYSDATPDVERTYNRMGNLATVSDAAGVRTFAYGAGFNLTGETIGGRTLSYTYSNTGVMGRCTGLAGNHAYSYDQYGRISQVNGISFTRLANSELVSQVSFPNGVVSLYGYESDHDIESGVAHGSFASCGYENNAIGNRVGMSRSGSVFAASDTISYSYNGRSELTGAVSDAANTDYSYAFSFDPIGNRLNATLAGQSVSYTADRLNQYTAVNADAPSYDLDGSMLTNGDWNYSWNGENRLVLAENAVTGAALEFDYDYMGRRIFKKVYHGTVLEKHLLFVYDGYKLIEERDALDGGALVRQYAWQPDALGRDIPLTVHDAASDATYYYHADANKNVTELTDETGAVVAHYEYSPFGTVTRATGSLAADNPFRFSSEYHDDETGLVYYNYRYYSPELGRWISRDPIEELGGYNLYGICLNNTINSFDSKGLAKIRFEFDNGESITMKNPSATDLEHQLCAMCNSERKTKFIWIYGHGNSDEMYVNDSHMKMTIHGREWQKGDVALLVLDGQIMLYENGGKPVNITSLLKGISNDSTTIYLNGCHTAQDTKWFFNKDDSIARQMSEVLPNVRVKGNTGYALGLLFCTFSDTSTYINGKRQ